MYIVTSNEKTSMTSAERRQDAADIFATLTSSPIALWQEINGTNQHDDIKSKEAAGTYHAFDTLPIPVSVPPRFQVLEERYVQAKDWTGTGATPDLGPVGDNKRYYGVLKLQDTNTPNLKPFYVINTHYTNGCEWDADGTPSAVALSLRPYWNTHWDMMKAEIDAIKAADFTVFWGGDFNRKNSPSFGTAEKLAVGDGKIDKLAVIDRSVDSLLKNTGTIVTLSDHDARWAKWDLSNRP